MDDLGSYVSDDELAVPALNELGWDVSTLSWRQTAIDWAEFEAVIIRTPWDYQKDPSWFLDVLSHIESRTRLENPSKIVRWNLDKHYLQEMESRGCGIVPTIWDAEYSEDAFTDWTAQLGSDDQIIKPTISATAEHTYRLSEYDPDLADVFATRAFMVQPFLQNIVSEGEYSLFYFSGTFSHAILKSPRPADFRVQEEHGGTPTAVTPSEQLLARGREIVDSSGSKLLYARVDLVRDDADNFLLMELELIEPALYFRMDEGSPRRFAEAFDEMMSSNA
jgi:hypothetical protein